MTSIEERVTALEERVFNNHSDKINDLSDQMKRVNDKLTTLIVLLCGNFAVAAFQSYLDMKGGG